VDFIEHCVEIHENHGITFDELLKLLDNRGEIHILAATLCATVGLSIKYSELVDDPVIKNRWLMDDTSTDVVRDKHARKNLVQSTGGVKRCGLTKWGETSRFMYDDPSAGKLERLVACVSCRSLFDNLHNFTYRR